LTIFETLKKNKKAINYRYST